MRRGAGARAGAVVSAGRLEPPRAAGMRAVGTVGPDGVLVAVGIDPQPPRGRAVVEATIADLGPEYVVVVLGSTVRISSGARVWGPDGERLGPDAIQPGVRVRLAGEYSDANGFVADDIRLRRRREFEIEKVVGPVGGNMVGHLVGPVGGPMASHDPAGLRLEIAGFRVVTSERTVYGDAESGEDPE